MTERVARKANRLEFVRETPERVYCMLLNPDTREEIAVWLPKEGTELDAEGACEDAE